MRSAAQREERRRRRTPFAPPRRIGSLPGGVFRQAAAKPEIEGWFPEVDLQRFVSCEEMMWEDYLVHSWSYRLFDRCYVCFSLMRQSCCLIRSAYTKAFKYSHQYLSPSLVESLEAQYPLLEGVCILGRDIL